MTSSSRKMLEAMKECLQEIAEMSHEEHEIVLQRYQKIVNEREAAKGASSEEEEFDVYVPGWDDFFRDGKGALSLEYEVNLSIPLELGEVESLSLSRFHLRELTEETDLEGALTTETDWGIAQDMSAMSDELGLGEIDLLAA